MVEPQIRYARTVDGVSIAYFAMGEGVPFVSIHMPISNLQHELATERVRVAHEQTAKNVRLIRYDHRGLGISDKISGAFETGDLVRDLEAVVDKVAPEGRLILFANHGAAYPIAIAYAAAHPERVLAIAAIVGGPTAAFTTAVAQMPGADWWFISETMARMIQGPGDPAAASELAQDIRASTDLEGYGRVSDWFLNATAELDAEVVQAPCLLLPTFSGGLDWIASARELASRMPNAVVQPVNEATFDQRVSKTRAAITAFLTRGRDYAEPRERLDAGTPVTSTAAVILFTDIVESTALTERLGDARFRELSRALDAGLRAAIRDAGGVAVEGKLLGDGVLATFGSAAQAIDGARRCLALSAASELGLHIGLHAGDVIREEVDGRRDVFGGAVNIAARICGLSAPGEILVSDVVRGMARTSAGVVFEDRGEQEMKGVGEAVRVYGVVGSS